MKLSSLLIMFGLFLFCSIYTLHMYYISLHNNIAGQKRLKKETVAGEI